MVLHDGGTTEKRLTAPRVGEQAPVLRGAPPARPRGKPPAPALGPVESEPHSIVGTPCDRRVRPPGSSAPGACRGGLAGVRPCPLSWVPGQWVRGSLIGADMNTVYTYDELAEYGAVVWSESPTLFVTWNGSATFNVWQESGFGHYLNTERFTRYGITEPEKAREAARDYFGPTGACGVPGCFDCV